MLTSLVEAELRPRPAYRSFRTSVARVVRMSPHFTRVTFAGDELAEFGTAGLDQRVKVVLPIAGRGFIDFPDGEDWYQAWRELPAERRNTFRTYTVRAVRPDDREVDIDFALHGDLGPASAWAMSAAPGDEIVLIGPDELSPGRALGIDFRPGTVDTVLLAGDETAAPAICAILEQLPAEATGVAMIEVPTADDRLAVRAPAGVEVRWLARSSADVVHGERLIPAVRDWVARTCCAQGCLPGAPTPADAVYALDAAERADLDDAPLWDVPEGVSLDGDCYAWLAGEASVIKTLRRFLVREAGMDRRQVAFMGYWRRGRAELD
ncbi:siderophore-interacting protein [Agromyces aerolatus]|uniref:siderophore-interacting protein n=1 Tax=Agromyces sp. LY-1074 TaxID=3074080 RepID=UPI0028610CBC|nr:MULTISPECIES: siderophore-interacting protein [unclassified Agromyces]MDR5701824.1 siderophore-interacting protein [Agromyces sp. LY-1074]MDR5707506.1 siderophore-interacting protein [Agromyces sp. LY-1358]